MNDVIELAKKCGLSKHEYRVGALVGYEITIQAFYEAAIEIGKAQGAKEFMEALGEPVGEIHWSDADDYNSTYWGELVESGLGEGKWKVGDKLFVLPNTKDEVK